MPAPTDISYTHDHSVDEAGTVTFRCSDDLDQWSWLELPPQHPVVLMSQSFWISVGCSMARGTLDPSKWSALTWVDWQIGDPLAGHGTHGKLEDTSINDALGFAITLEDAQGRLIYRMRGKGVVFRNRDFEGWREESKIAVTKNQPQDGFLYAPVEAVGAAQGERSLVSTLEGSVQPRALALVTASNGMPPASRHLTGSGDHVNATHIGECARQFVALLTSDPGVKFRGGEIRFDRYIEMDTPFEIAQTERSDRAVSLTLGQSGKGCSAAKLLLA